jgi:hypothetical protein
MKTEHYTSDGRHPEDAIYKAKTFINELEEVQKTYFDRLAYELNMSKEGEEWLFDYVYNAFDEYDDFEHYLTQFNKTYNDMIKKDTMYTDSAETFLSTDFGEFSPMMHMSSCEPSLGTAFPPAYNDNEPISLGLDTITVKQVGIETDNK